MAHRFKNIDRDTPMLLPPDLRDRVEEDDLVHFVIAAVERLPLSQFAVNHKGTGSEQYPPRVLLALLIYCYADGLFSSRRIQRAPPAISPCATSAATPIPTTTPFAPSVVRTSQPSPPPSSRCLNWPAR